MKKSLSIVLVGILALNVLGYYGIFLGMRYRNDIAMMKALDSDSYDPSHEVTIKVAVSIPYMPDQSDFERVNGKFEYQGELYRLVRQRYAKDTLTVVCLKDMEHTKINQVLADYINTFTPENTNSSKVTFKFLKDYLPAAFAIHRLSPGWSAEAVLNTHNTTLTSSFKATIVQPPEGRSIL